MFGDSIGTRQTIDGTEYLRTEQGKSGHALFGPYDFLRPGLFEVEFEIGLVTPERPGAHENAVCAILDVAANGGTAQIVSREVRFSELGEGLTRFTLTFNMYDFRSMEYRVFATGTDALLVREARLTRISGTPEPRPEPDPRADTNDPAELHRQVRHVLRLLRPQRVKGFDKVRLGNAGDGGYVMIDDLAGIDVALSFGINEDISWDSAVADRGMTVYQYDHTVEDPAPDDPRMVFHKMRIDAHTTSDSQNLEDLVRRHDKGAARPNMILKMDIENHEWPVILATSDHALGRFAQILCELHWFQGLADHAFRTKIYDSLKKLTRHYAVVHVHGNICGGISNHGGVVIPNVMEFAFVNREMYDLEDTDELFPGPLDISCDANQPDFFLGSFRF